MSVSDIINSVIAGIAFISLIITALLTFKQIRLSNKHQLFERRISTYELINDVLFLYDENRPFILRDRSIHLNVNYPLMALVDKNSNKINISTIGIREPIHFDKLIDMQNKLDKTAIEIPLIWSGESAIMLSSFIEQYSDLIHIFVEQTKYLDKLTNTSVITDDKEFISKANASASVLGFYETIEQIDKTYQKIIDTKAEQNIINQTKLIKRIEHDQTGTVN